MEIFWRQTFSWKSKNMTSHIWLKLCLELHVLCMKMFIVFFSGIIIINGPILKKNKVIYFFKHDCILNMKCIR